MAPLVVYIFDMLGVMVFAISGALVGLRKELDLFGIMVVGIVTAIGGGTLRDLLLDVGPVFWVSNPRYVLLAAATALLTVPAAARFETKIRYLLWADALGISFYGLLGVRTSIAAGAPPITAVLLATLGAVAGGAIRDVLCAQTPLVLRAEIYATAVMAGAAGYLGLIALNAPRPVPLIAGFLICLGLRLAGIHFKLSLPRTLISKPPT